MPYWTCSTHQAAQTKHLPAADLAYGVWWFRPCELDAQMKAWSRAQANQEREANLYHHHQAEAELIHSYLHSQQHQQAVQAAVAAASTTAPTAEQGVPYGVPIPPPLVPSPGEHYVVDDHCRGGDPREEHSPLPPPRSSSSGQGRSRGKRSRHTGASSSSGHQHHEGSRGRQQQESQVSDIHYPKYELYGQYKYSGSNPQGGDCQYQTKYGEDCHVSSSQQQSSKSQQQQPSSGKGSGDCQYNKSWPKQHYPEDQGLHDDPHVQYLQDLEAAEAAQAYEEQQHQQQHQREARGYNKKRSKESSQQYDKRQYREQRAPRDKSPCQQDYPTLSARDREYLVSTVGAKQHLVQQQQQQLEAEHPPGSAPNPSTLQVYHGQVTSPLSNVNKNFSKNSNNHRINYKLKTPKSIFIQHYLAKYIYPRPFLLIL